MRSHQNTITALNPATVPTPVPCGIVPGLRALTMLDIPFDAGGAHE
jgi:hypothetical protein